MHRILTRGPLAVLASTALLIPAAAQESEQIKPPPAMRVSTSQTAWAQAIVSAFGIEEEVVELKDGEHIRLTIEADGSSQQVTLEAPIPGGSILQVHLRPEAMLKVFDRRVTQMQKLGGAVLSRMLDASKYPPQAATTMLADLRELLSQCSGAFIEVHQSDERIQVRLDVVPLPKTSLFRKVKFLSPNAKGVVDLPLTDETPLRFAVSMNHDTLPVFWRPIANFMSQRGGKDDAGKEQVLNMLMTAPKMFDGSLAGVMLAGEHHGAMVTVAGLVDKNAHAAQLKDDAHSSWLIDGNLTAGTTMHASRKALDHRDIPSMTLITESLRPAGQPTEVISQTMYGQVGDYEVSARGMADAAPVFKRFADDILDGKLLRPKKPTRNMLDLRILADYLGKDLERTLAAFDLTLPTGDKAPEHVHFRMHKIGVTVKCELTID